MQAAHRRLASRFRTGRMGARGNQIGNRGTWVAAGDQTFAYQHRVSARAGVRQQVSGATHAGFSNPDHTARQTRSYSREAIPVHVQRHEVAA